MGSCRIEDYSPIWRDQLRAYMRRTFPLYASTYIEYCLDHAYDKTPSIIAVNEKGEVVGCHLYYCTKALLKKEELETQWGHDTFLDEEYRKEIGVDFLLARKKIPAFGVGLTETNTKMRKLMKSVFLKGVFNYYTITPAVVVSLFQRLFHINAHIKNVDTLKIKGKIFRRVNSVKEMQIPNGGFWYKECYDLDFIRDASFLDYRFFKCNVHDYLVYTTGDSYFVVRGSMFRGIPAMMLSDFRYNPTVPESVEILFKAVMKLAMKSSLGIVYFVCGDKNVDRLFHNKICYKTSMDFITSYKVPFETTFSISGGDSDCEFLKT